MLVVVIAFALSAGPAAADRAEKSKERKKRNDEKQSLAMTDSLDVKVQEDTINKAASGASAAHAKAAAKSAAKSEPGLDDAQIAAVQLSPASAASVGASGEAVEQIADVASADKVSGSVATELDEGEGDGDKKKEDDDPDGDLGIKDKLTDLLKILPGIKIVPATDGKDEGDKVEYTYKDPQTVPEEALNELKVHLQETLAASIKETDEAAQNVQTASKKWIEASHNLLIDAHQVSRKALETHKVMDETHADLINHEMGVINGTINSAIEEMKEQPADEKTSSSMTEADKDGEKPSDKIKAGEGNAEKE